jgi:broad specificity phosphatase PhoE
MTTRLWLLCLPASTALRRGVFADDETLTERELAPLPALAPALPAVSRIYCSPARSARQTAEALHLTAEPTAALADADYGRWCGSALAEIAEAEPAALQVWLQDPAAAPHGGESFAALTQRVAAWLDALPDGEDALVISHANVLRAALLHALSVPLSSFGRLDIAPLTLLELQRTPRGWSWRSAPLNAST